MTGLFGIDPGVDFAPALRAGLLQRVGDDPAQLARSRIFTNTRRAARRIIEDFRTMAAVALPQITVLGDIGADPGLPRGAPPPKPFEREFQVMHLVKQLLATRPELAPQSAAYGLARSLCDLMDEFAADEISFEALADIGAAEFSEHWQLSLAFLDIVKAFWAQHETLAIGGGEARAKAAIARLDAQWQANPPSAPIIFAGSTGSRSASRALMKAVMATPRGAVVLPGFDRHLSPEVWQVLAADNAPGDHPQAVFARLFNALGTDQSVIRPWCDTAPIQSARGALVSLALRPAPVTDGWIKARDEVAENAGQAMEKLAIVEAANPREEAQAIALELRRALEDGGRAALITPDANLARRVSALMRRWNIRADDSAGAPLSLTPVALFWQEIASFALKGRITDFVSFLKHPLCASGGERGTHLRMVRHLDATCLREGGASYNPARFAKWGAAQPERAGWLSALDQALTGLPDPTQPLPFKAHIAALGRVMEALATLLGGDTAELTRKPADQAFAKLLSDLTAAADDALALPLVDVLGIVAAEAARARARDEEYRPDARVVIWGQLEARVQGADTTILAGLNEGIWPAAVPADHWLNRQMRAKLGLALPEYRIGLAAHDFQIAMGNDRVVLSRTKHDGAAPTVAARWVLRLQNLLEGSGDAGKTAWAQARARGDQTLKIARRIDRRQSAPPQPRPCPAPPVHVRPRQISVSDVERHDRDPYAIYARRILNLKPLDILGRPPNFMDRGIAAHEVMEAFIRADLAGTQTDREATLRRVGDEVLRDLVPWAATRALWHARLMRFAPELIAREARRRETGQPRADWLEVTGNRSFTIAGSPLQITTRADRIDEVAGGGAAIYDYKFSAPKDRLKYNVMQLMLEAQIMEAGGFAKVGQRFAQRAELIILGKPSEDHEVDDLVNKITEHHGWFVALMEDYLSGKKHYPPRLKEREQKRRGDYDHLARFGEWRDGDPLVPQVFP